MRRFREGASHPLSRLRRLRDTPQHRRYLRDGISDLKRSAPQLPDQETIERLILGCGSSWTTDRDYAMAVASEAAAAKGPILECGSGLTTIIAAIYSRHGVWSLEHLPHWHRRVTSELRRNGLQGAHVSLTPLRRYDDFDWYSVDRLPLPPSFALVICDGPPGETRGGRVGLLPVMESRISSAVVLLDDANRPGEAAVLDTWNRRYGVFVERPAGTRYAVVRSGGIAP